MKKIGLLAVIAAVFMFASCDMINDILGKNPVITTGTVSGTVLYNNSSSSEGITVKLEKVEGDVTKPLASLGNSRVAYSDGVVDVTSKDGSFSFENVPEGKYKVYASSYYSQAAAISEVITVRAAETTKVTELALTALGSVKGNVVYDGAPRSDIDVYVAGVNYCAKTDAGGNYKLTGIPAGTKVAVVAAYDGAKKTAREVTVRANEEVSVETISLEPVNKATTGTVKGKVLYGEDAEELIFVTISGTTFIAYTDADGNYTFTGIPAGEVKITTKRGDQVLHSEPVTVVAGQETVVPDLVFEVKEIEEDPHQIVALKHVKYVKATEDGVVFQIALPEVSGLSHNSGSSVNEILSVSGAGISYSIDTTNVGNNPYYRFVFPFVEAGKDYDFTISLYDSYSSYYYFQENVKVTAVGGAGELTIDNEDELNFRIEENSQDSVVVKIDEIPEVSCSKDLSMTKGIEYTIAKNTSMEKAWDEGCVWLFAPSWNEDDPRVKAFDIFNQYTYLQDTWYWRNVGTMKGYLRGEIVQVTGTVKVTLDGMSGSFTKQFGIILDQNSGKKTVVNKHVTINPEFENEEVILNIKSEKVPYGTSLQTPLEKLKVESYDLEKLEAFARKLNEKRSEPYTGTELEAYIADYLKQGEFCLNHYEFSGYNYGYYAKQKGNTNLRFIENELKYDSAISMEFHQDYDSYSVTEYELMAGEPVTDVYIYPQKTMLNIDFTFVVDGKEETKTVDIMGGNGNTLGYTPVKSGYTFTGWYTDKDCKVKFVMDDVIDGITVLYAGFAEIKAASAGFTESFETGLSEYFSGTWEITNETANNGLSCLKSPVTNHSSYSDMTLYVCLKSAGTLTFAYKTSSESGCDQLQLLINGSSIIIGSGEMTLFNNYSVSLPAGSSSIVFRYQKDGSVSNGNDCVYIDDIVISAAASN